MRVVMADPTIQTFCCYHDANATGTAITIMEEFNSAAYNAVCMFSSLLGVMGAVYQMLPRQQFTNSHRWLSFTAVRGRQIIVWLALADLFAALGVCARSAVWLNHKNPTTKLNKNPNVVDCIVFSAFIQYFYTATWIWTVCYAADVRLILREKEPKTTLYHLGAWLVPALTTSLGLSLLYYPDASCHTSSSLPEAIYRILPNYLATYIPIVVVMILNPWLYCRSCQDLEKIVMNAAGRFTSKEREILEAVRIKFAVINFVFYVCWIPNLVNGVLLWALWFHLPEAWVISMWYTMALLNPLQAFFNCIVYRRWRHGSERVVVPWRQLEKPECGQQSAEECSASVGREEILPLLNSRSINRFKHYS